MADQETADSNVATEEAEYTYNVKIEDLGPATKKIVIDIPEDRIKEKLAEQYKELRSQAAIPGFRPGHAPQKLIEKRFSSDVKDQVRRSLVSESYEQALEKNNLNVLGEPDFENPDAIQLPETGSMNFSFTVEVQPEFTIPDLTNLKVKKPKIEVKDENVDQAMQNLREQQGALMPVEDRGVQEKDYLLADVHVKEGGNEVAHQHDAQIVARPGRIGGIQIDDLDKQLEGLKPGETRTIKTKAPDTHPNEALRGKDVEIDITLKDLKHLELAEINQAFLEDLGFENEGELRDALREQMVERIDYDVQQALREQVSKHLLESIHFDLPAKLSTKQADRVVNRRAVELMQRGLGRDQIEANIDKLRAGADEEAGRELKLFFILQKLSTDLGVDVDEGELNGRIAMLAAQRGRRPEKLKQDMAKDGTLSNLYLQMREQKAIDKVLEKAQIEEVEVADKAGEEKTSEEKPAEEKKE
jgi:trigger factor